MWLCFLAGAFDLQSGLWTCGWGFGLVVRALDLWLGLCLLSGALDLWLGLRILFGALDLKLGLRTHIEEGGLRPRFLNQSSSCGFVF